MNKEELEKVEKLIEQKNSEELKGLLSGYHSLKDLSTNTGWTLSK